MDYPVSTRAFRVVQRVDVNLLNSMSEKEIRPILPCLVRMSLCAPLDSSHGFAEKKKMVLKILSGMSVVNTLVNLLSIDFEELDHDMRKEIQIRQKIGSDKSESILANSLQHGIGLEFERSAMPRRMRLLLSELLLVMAQMKEHHTEFYVKQSELFDSKVYLEDISDVLCITQAELPGLLPLVEVSEALLHLKNGPWLLCRLIANAPESFVEVCESLVINGEKQDEETNGGAIRSRTLRMLGQMNPTSALYIRALTVEHCHLPGLAVALTLDHYKTPVSMSEDEESDNGRVGSSDLVPFITGLLLGNDANVRTWFASYIRISQKRKKEASLLYSLREELTLELLNVIPLSDGFLPHHHVIQASCLLRLYSALRGIAALKFSDEETRLLVQLITSRPVATAAGVRFLSLGLCMLIACPFLITNIDEDRRVVQWIKWFLADAKKFESVSGSEANFGEMLLLLAIHFHGNQTSAIIDLVCSTLGMKIQVRVNTLSRLRAMFTQEIFTGHVVTSHAVQVPVTPHLNATMTGYLPVHCIHQLLKNRSFTKHKVPIKDWICRQICNSSTPLHPLMPPLIQSFITSVIVPPPKGDQKLTNEPLTEREILSVFETTDATQPGNGMVPQLLMLYYLLLFEDVRLANMKNLVSVSKKVQPYSAQVYAQLPMRYLVQEAQKEQQLYAGLFAPLLKLLTMQFPHLCQVEEWMVEDAAASHLDVQHLMPELQLTVEELKNSLSDASSSPGKCTVLLEQLTVKSPNELLPFTECLVESMPLLLGREVPRQVLTLLHAVWVKLNIIIPLKLGVLTVNSLRLKTTNKLQPIIPYTQNDIVVDPLIVLRCDERVFRCPPILEIILRLLRSYLAASRAHLATHIQCNPLAEKHGQVSSDAEREELKNALVAAQESAAAQILLEICLSTKEDQLPGLLSDLREVRCIICSHLHQCFITDPYLAKLVHFQGYRSELLPMTVAGIPSMHICLDFIPELLSQPHPEKQMFAVELVSHLVLQYPLPKSLSVARLSVNVISQLLTVLPSDVLPDFYVPLMPAMSRICRAFPPLVDDIVSFLVQLGQIALSAAALQGSHSPLSIDSEDIADLPKESQLCCAVRQAFQRIVQASINCNTC